MKRTRLVEARQRKNWTLEDAAARLCVDPHTLWRWEDGRVVPRAHSKAQLCTVYGASAQELGLECEDFQDPQRALVITMETATTMTDNLKVNLRQDLTSRLMRIVWSWNHKDQYQELQGQINQAVDDYNAVIEQDVERHMTRRDALRSLILFSVETCTLNVTRKANDPVEDLLAQCASGITVCWYFRQGKELRLANDAINVYISTLQSILRSSREQYRQDAAAMLVQCYLLRATLARYLENNERSLIYLNQAEDYTKIANNVTLSILTARTIAATHNFADRQDLALQFAEKAKSLINKETPPQLQSFVYAGLATYQAHCGKDPRDALSSLSMAYKTFDHNNSIVWFDHTLSNLFINEGEMQQHLGKQQKAIEAFDQVLKLGDEDTTQTGRVFSYLEQTLAEVSRDDNARDIDYCTGRLIQGIQGAIELHSELEFATAKRAYQMLRVAWPGEQRVKDLRDLLVHW